MLSFPPLHGSEIEAVKMKTFTDSQHRANCCCTFNSWIIILSHSPLHQALQWYPSIKLCSDIHHIHVTNVTHWSPGSSVVANTSIVAAPSTICDTLWPSNIVLLIINHPHIRNQDVIASYFRMQSIATYSKSIIVHAVLLEAKIDILVFEAHCLVITKMRHIIDTHESSAYFVVRQHALYMQPHTGQL